MRDFLYADDAAVLWLSREAMQAGMSALVAHGKRWGLEVHVSSSADVSSKTEYIVVPPSSSHASYQESYDRSPVQLDSGGWFTHAVTRINKVDHPGIFKYLGSYICESLSEDFDVEQRISAASKAFGRFKKTIFANKALSSESKARAFTAFVLSNLFYQSECWALRADQMARVRSFFNRCVRVMTGVNRNRQWIERLTSSQLAERLGLRTCESYLDERCLRWVGHVARMPATRLPRLTLFSWHSGKRAKGRPQQTFRHRLRNILLKLPDRLPDVEKRQMLSSGWVASAQDRAGWQSAIDAYCDIPERVRTRRVGRSGGGGQ